MAKDDPSENWNLNAFFWILVEEAAGTVLEKDTREGHSDFKVECLN